MRRPCRQRQLHPFPPPKYATVRLRAGSWDPLHSAPMTLHRVRCLCQRIPFNSLQEVTKDLSSLMINSSIDPTITRERRGGHDSARMPWARSSDECVKGFDENPKAFVVKAT